VNDRQTPKSKNKTIAAGRTANEPEDANGNAKKWPPIWTTEKINVTLRNNGKKRILTTGVITVKIVKVTLLPHLCHSLQRWTRYCRIFTLFHNDTEKPS